MIRVLITDDSPTMRMVVRSVLESDPELRVVGEACNGKDAFDKCKALDPDIVTMDIRMPKMNGIDAINLIMAKSPRPIVVLTSTKSDMELGITFKAVEAGALMVIRKPHGLAMDHSLKQNLIGQIKAMARVKVVGRRRKLVDKEPVTPQIRPDPKRTTGTKRLIAIGASTGGPPALLAILRQLPADLPVPVLVVQHISSGFVKGLVKWLDNSIAMKVKIAENAQRLNPGTVYITPDDRHATVDRYGRVWLIDSPKVDGHRPSATVLFESVADNYGTSAIGLLLTGMGKDGAVGLKKLHDAGGYTVAQDEATSIVFGMPKEAIKLGGTDEVLPIHAIAGRLMGIMSEEMRIKNDEFII